MAYLDYLDDYTAWNKTSQPTQLSRLVLLHARIALASSCFQEQNTHHQPASSEDQGKHQHGPIQSPQRD